MLLSGSVAFLYRFGIKNLAPVELGMLRNLLLDAHKKSHMAYTMWLR